MGKHLPTYNSLKNQGEKLIKRSIDDGDDSAKSNFSLLYCIFVKIATPDRN